ncbi:MAG: hypothetical protein J6Q34_04335 [Bacteroidales bacterium]|nr:hypothetical protein [Bacteroidales bacterium]
MIKVGILKETKHPVDNRVALVPEQIISLQKKFPYAKFYIQKSDIRAYSDNEYASLGISVVDNVDDCDVLLGIKEADINTLLPNKHYIFFGHIAKEQPYNQPLIRKMVELGITFSDYEYFVDDNNQRLCAFGWWAGVVGTYNSLRAYGLRYKLFELPKPDMRFTLEKLLANVKEIAHLCKCKVVLTGAGRVSQGAQYVMKHIGACQVTPSEFLKLTNVNELTYVVLDLDYLVEHIDPSIPFDLKDFIANGQNYKSSFAKYAYVADVLISCHYWSPGYPVYLDNELLKDPNLNIKVIGDITCDIQGSIMSTLRASTHDEPFYDFCTETLSEKTAFSNLKNITVMAVDTCPNALALDTSRYFGEALSEHVFPLILSGHTEDPIIARATILKDGQLTDRYIYLKEYAGL